MCMWEMGHVGGGTCGGGARGVGHVHVGDGACGGAYWPFFLIDWISRFRMHFCQNTS